MAPRKHLPTTVAVSHEAHPYRPIVVDVPLSHIAKGYAVTHTFSVQDGFAQVPIFDNVGLLWHVPTGKLLWRFKDKKYAVQVIDWLDYFLPEFALVIAPKEMPRPLLNAQTDWLYWLHRAEKVLDMWMATVNHDDAAISLEFYKDHRKDTDKRN